MTKKELTKQIRAAGEDIARNAENIADENCKNMTDLSIWVRISDEYWPTYEVQKEYHIWVENDQEVNYD